MTAAMVSTCFPVGKHGSSSTETHISSMAQRVCRPGTDSSLSSEFQARTASLNPSKVCILGIHDTQRIGSPAPDCQSGKNAMAKDPKQKVQAHPPRWRAVKETIAPPRTRCHLAHGQPGMPQVHRLRTPAVRSRQPAPQVLWVAHLTWPNCNGAENEKIKL